MVMAYASGILCAYILGSWLSYSTVIIIYLVTCALFFPAWWFMPESPAYLVLNEKDKVRCFNCSPTFSFEKALRFDFTRV